MRVIDWARKRKSIIAPLLAVPSIFSVEWALCAPLGIQGSLTTFIVISLISLLLSSWYYILLKNKISNTKSGDLTLKESISKRMYGIIGVIAPISYWSTSFYVDIIRGIRAEAERRTDEYRHQIVIFDVPSEEFTIKTQDTINLCTEVLDALININMEIDTEFRKCLYEKHIPIINIHHKNEAPPSILSIIPDLSAFEELAKDLIIDKQCASIVLVTKVLCNPFKKAKIDPIRKEKRDIIIKTAKSRDFKVTVCSINDFNGTIDRNQVHIIEVDQYYSSYGKVIYEKIIHTDYPKVTAMVFLADDIAVGFLQECNNSGRTLSQLGFRISGFDNTTIAKVFDLTSVDNSLSAVGQAACAEVEGILQNPQAIEYTDRKVKTVLRKGKTTEW